jgi:hypothetical protein
MSAERPDGQRDYRDDYPLSDAIRDAYNEGLSGGQSWASAPTVDERDYATARADALEAGVALLVEAAQDLLDHPRSARASLALRQAMYGDDYARQMVRHW